MRKPRAFLPFLVCLCASIASAQQPDTAWVTFTSPDKSFSILCPGHPQLTETKQLHALNRMWTLAEQGPVVYLAGYSDYDSKISVEKELELDRDNFLTTVQAKLVASKRTEFERGPNDKLPSLEFTGENPNYNFKCLVILDDQRAYFFGVGGKGDILANTEKFLSSLKLYPPQR
jgi:hypothetical protein